MKSFLVFEHVPAALAAAETKLPNERPKAEATFRIAVYFFT
jgi:hypothetical protein